MTQQYLVITEADGMKPSSSFYERRSKLALKVRTKDLDLTATPMVRRGMGEHLGTIVQEGVCITSSYSQAKLVAELARAYGIKVIFFGKADLAAYEATAEDRAAFEKVDKVLSKRGRKNEPELHVVCCFEEMKTFEITAAEILLCPSCGGTNLATRLGSATRVPPPTEEENINVYWLMSRFVNGEFEIPVADEEWQSLPLQPHAIPENDLNLVAAIINGEVGKSALSLPMSPKGKLDLLDAVFVARTRWPQVTRDNTRAEAMICWIRKFGGDGNFPLVEGEPDIIDAAGIIGVERALNIFKAYTLEKTK